MYTRVYFVAQLHLVAYRLVNSEYEHIALHRDVGETELKQGREIRTGGNLVYVDSAAVRAVKHGRVLIIEGVEKAERGIMPVSNCVLDAGQRIMPTYRIRLSIIALE